MKKKIIKYSLIAFIIGICAFGIHYVKTEILPYSIGYGGVAGEGCDLATQHLEYNEKTGKQECVEGEMM